MEQDMNADNTDSAPVEQNTSDSSFESGDESTGIDLSPSEEMAGLLAERDATKSLDSEVEPSQLDSESDKTESNRKDLKKEDKPSHEGFQKRINKEVARRKAIEEDYSKASLELAELKDKFELLLEENAYLFERAEVDEREETLRQREYSLRLKESKEQISAKHRESLEKRQMDEQRVTEEEQRRESIDSIKSEVLSAAAQYTDDAGQYLFDPKLILDKILTAANSGQYLSAEQAAQLVEKERAQAWSKRLKAPPAPRSAGSASSGNRNSAKEVDYTDRNAVREDAADFFRQLIAERTGRK